MDLERLKNFFHPDDIEWRIARSGESNGRIWAKAVAYVDNRAIMRRLDEVCGPAQWSNEYRPGPSGGVICGIGIWYVEDGFGGWIWKWDGAENPKTEPVKGGLSNAMKRAAVQWGIGRYLYDLPETFVEVGEYNKYPNKASTKSKKRYSWKTPPIPEKFLPDGAPATPEEPPRMDPDNETAEPETHVKTITEEQIITLTEICEEKNFRLPDTINRLAQKYGADKIKAMPADRYEEAVAFLDSLPPYEPEGDNEK